MKRDMDLIRSILLKQEGVEEIDLADFTQEQINYHTALLIEAEYVDGTVHYSSRGGKNSDEIPDMVRIKKIMWNGHEFLDQARNNTAWEKAKKFILDKGQTLSIDSIRIALGVVIKEALK
jgi:hypothetical protein